MNEQSRKWTRGPATVRDLGHGISVEPSIAWCGDTTAHRYSETKANGALIAEAFNVATETGLTPRQLAERVRELESIISIITLNARLQPDASMGGSTDCYAVPLSDIADARAALRATNTP